jgi:cytochrome c
MASRISLAFALLGSAINTAVASALATLLTFTVALAITQQFGTAEEARAMLDRAAAALKSDEAKALRDFNDTKNKLYHDRDLYISCFNTSDGKFTAFPGSGMVGMDVRTFKLGDDPIGQRAFNAVQDTQEGTVSTMDYNFPKAGKPAVKQSLQTRVGDQGCGVSFYK